MTPIRAAMQRLVEGGSLSAEESGAAIGQIIDGQCGESEIAGLLSLIAARGETAEVLSGAVQAVRQRMTPLNLPKHLTPLIDTCGTGGDGASTVNISSAVAIVLAACGVRVAKHGNRSASGRSGSADVFTALGVKIDAPPAVLVHCLEEVNIAFLFAPMFHPALRHAAPVRKQLPFRTLFNLVGPLANPAHVEFQLIGVPDPVRADLLACTLLQLINVSSNSSGPVWPRTAAVVCSADGLDEVSLGASTYVRHVRNGFVEPAQTLQPDLFGLGQVAPQALKIATVQESAQQIQAMLTGQKGPVRDVVLANTAVALVLARPDTSLTDAVSLAAEAIDSGNALQVLARWGTISHSGTAESA